MGFSPLDAPLISPHVPGYRTPTDFALVSSDVITRSEVAETLLALAAGLGQ